MLIEVFKTETIFVQKSHTHKKKDCKAFVLYKPTTVIVIVIHLIDKIIICLRLF